MSRSPGARQRRIVLALDDAGDEGLYPFEIRGRVGGDRPNTRRSIRSLIRRGLVEQTDGGQLALAFWGRMMAGSLKAPDYEAEQEEERRRFEDALAAWRAEREEERRLWFEEEERWERRSSTYERDRFPGQNQLRVLAVLYRYPPDLQTGLPKGAVAEIVGGDKRNTARAIRSLLRRGTIQQTLDGERLRLPGALPPGSRLAPFFNLWTCAISLLEEPLDDDCAEVLLESYGEMWEGVA